MPALLFISVLGISAVAEYVLRNLKGTEERKTVRYVYALGTEPQLGDRVRS